MLDNETKRKIDSARSILVGKVPDPKAQVEQITTALIYKFMDDMDREAEELGGHAKFITGELEPYTWARLMSKELSGAARLNLYMSALLDFAKSADIPPIFRTIFKDAFLPYRDPETLSLFLKEIDYFDYDHSENLGNAFEYLLSILGSQGDAGQFRTPRHIIDFIVEVLEPKKNETVLDPACGTAGFLISAYKHIMAKNTLTPDEKKALMHNFTGYDISPDMVRLSLVNMYLHSFPTPKIYEYDTLTSEERWNESFDVILANPPFMTPKGGIRPHNRFSVKANRSEVLFVDYIAEHLSLNGRAGIIVPEGIIFQSANAYKALRKMLIENNLLWAVVSLPAGVFQPYSGVKTSILLLDRTIAKHKEEILFVKVANDGFDLGAQRREISKNDLPTALDVLKQYRFGEAINNPIAQAVLKIKIAESGDYNLTGDRYRENTRAVQTAYPMVKLGEVCELGRGFAFKSEDYSEDGVFCFRVTNIDDNGKSTKKDAKYLPLSFLETYKNYELQENDFVIVMVGATTGKVGLVTKNVLPALLNQNMWRFFPKENINRKYLYALIKELPLLRQGGARDYLTQKDFLEIEIPLPPLEIQNEIVEQIEEGQKIIDGAKQVINTYRPTITIDPSWDIVKLGDVCEINPKKAETKELSMSLEVSFVPMDSLNEHEMLFTPKQTKKLEDVYGGYTYFKNGDVLIAKVTPCFENGKAGLAENLVNGIGFGSSEFTVLRANDRLSNKFLYFSVSNSRFIELGKEQMSGTGGLRRLTKHFVENYEIPLPPLEIQNEIVEQIEKERQAVGSCKTLVEIFEAKIKAKIDEVWGN